MVGSGLPLATRKVAPATLAEWPPNRNTTCPSAVTAWTLTPACCKTVVRMDTHAFLGPTPSPQEGRADLVVLRAPTPPQYLGSRGLVFRGSRGLGLTVKGLGCNVTSLGVDYLRIGGPNLMFDTPFLRGKFE